MLNPALVERVQQALVRLYDDDYLFDCIDLDGFLVEKDIYL